MPNGYNSKFTGEHNDEYDDRILTLTNRIATLENLLNVTLISPIAGSDDVSIAGGGAVCY